jgi:uncharacterized protein
VALPVLSTRVTDLTNTLDATQRGRLEAQLAAIERSGRAQAAVLLLPTTQPETIEQFGIRLAEAWKVGRKGADNGLILIVAKDDRRMRIEVGYGLEGVLPDAIASRIVNERMAPAFRQGDFFGGLQTALAAIEGALGGEPAAPLAAAAPPSAPDATEDWFTWLTATLVAAGVLRAIFGLLGSLVAAAVGGWLGFMIFGSWPAALIAALVVFVFSFGRVSAGGGGGFGGSSGGGGFSGGGGGFGGGGASGRW